TNSPPETTDRERCPPTVVLVYDNRRAGFPYRRTSGDASVSRQPGKARGRALVVSLLVSVAAGASFPAPPSRAAPPPQGEKKDAGPKVTAVPEEVARKFKLDATFYKKHVDYKGFSILSSAKVSDAALLEARYLIDQLLGQREDVL